MSKQKFNKKFINDFVDEVEKEIIDFMDSFALRAHGRLVNQTPVDTGQARAGWNFSLNVIDKSAPAKPPKGTVLPVPNTPIPNATKLGDGYHISNFVEHIVYLNEGVPIGTQHSQKAPLNFIETEINAALADVRRSS
jgi:hypothetical protein